MSRHHSEVFCIATWQEVKFERDEVEAATGRLKFNRGPASKICKHLSAALSP